MWKIDEATLRITMQFRNTDEAYKWASSDISKSNENSSKLTNFSKWKSYQNFHKSFETSIEFSPMSKLHFHVETQNLNCSQPPLDNSVARNLLPFPCHLICCFFVWRFSWLFNTQHYIIDDSFMPFFPFAFDVNVSRVAKNSSKKRSVQTFFVSIVHEICMQKAFSCFM